ncbi:MAG: lipoyl synthase [Candidatus Omnitrophota bacterium]
MSAAETLPSWFKQSIPDTDKIRTLKNSLQASHIHTVCQSAQCPNVGQCWSKKVATFMILGDRCTRLCRFCAVSSGDPHPVDHREPYKVAQMVKVLGCRYIVVTSVTRDDLADGGAFHFAQTIFEIKKLCPDVKIEVLIPDFSGDPRLLKIVTDSRPDVLSHNMETVKRLFKTVRPQADYQRSLDVLTWAGKLNNQIAVKSGFMVGLGETNEEIRALVTDIRATGCQILTIGQYLAPTKTQRHLRVERFVPPEEFKSFRQYALTLGFQHVASGPLVRSSYLAEEGYKSYQRNKARESVCV